MVSVIMTLVVVMYPYQQKRKFFLLDHLMTHKFRGYFLTARKKKNAKCPFFLQTNIDNVGSRLIFFLVVGNFLLVLSVVSNIFRPLSLVG